MSKLPFIMKNTLVTEFCSEGDFGFMGVLTQPHCFSLNAYFSIFSNSISKIKAEYGLI